MSLSPVKVLEQLAISKSAEDASLQSILLEILSYQRGQYFIAPGSADVTASATGEIFIEPPTADDEWEILALNVFDNAGIDANDTVRFQLQDAIQVFALDLVASLALSVWNQSTMKWPVTQLQNPRDEMLPPKILLVFRKSTGESYIRGRVLVATTATVGTRQFRSRTLIQSRPRMKR